MVLELFLGTLIIVFMASLPGYFLVLGMFPAKIDLTLLERGLLSIVFSLIFPTLLMAVENMIFNIPIVHLSILGNCLFLILLGLVSYMVRIKSLNVPEFFYKIFPKIDSEPFPLIPNFKK